MARAPADQEIIWSDDFLIGIEELDYEHRCLIEDINKLHRELLKHVETDRIEDTLGKIHMVSHKYLHYQEHKAEHERLLDEYTERMAKFEKDPNRGDRLAIEDVLRQWIVDHILTSDKKMSLMVISGKQT